MKRRQFVKRCSAVIASALAIIGLGKPRVRPAPVSWSTEGLSWLSVGRDGEIYYIDESGHQTPFAEVAKRWQPIEYGYRGGRIGVIREG